MTTIYKQALFVLMAVLTSCSVKQPVVKYSGSIDFRDFAEKGFHISESDKPNFEYEQVASLSAVFKSGYEPVMKDGRAVMLLDTYGNPRPNLSNRYVKANLNEMLNMLYKEALDKGANGIINLKFSALSEKTKMGVIYTGFQVSGWAIKKQINSPSDLLSNL